MSEQSDPRVSGIVEKTIRCTRILRTVGFDTLELSLAVAFHDAKRPWTARALADYICHPRTNVLKRLREHEKSGWFSKAEDGWLACPRTQEIYNAFLMQFADLMAGERSGFSPEIVAFFEGAIPEMRRPTRRKMNSHEALSIAFPRYPLMLRHVRERD